MTPDEVSRKIKTLVLEEFLPDDDPADLTDTTELVTSGVLDSLGVLSLVSLLEEAFGIEISAKEARAGRFDTVADIAKLVASKLGT